MNVAALTWEKLISAVTLSRWGRSMNKFCAAYYLNILSAKCCSNLWTYVDTTVKWTGDYCFGSPGTLSNSSHDIFYKSTSSQTCSQVLKVQVQVQVQVLTSRVQVQVQVLILQVQVQVQVQVTKITAYIHRNSETAAMLTSTYEALWFSIIILCIKIS